ncbi:MAG: hypothetical protein ACI8TL_000801 [Natronomonas sp.]
MIHLTGRSLRPRLAVHVRSHRRRLGVEGAGRHQIRPEGVGEVFAPGRAETGIRLSALDIPGAEIVENRVARDVLFGLFGGNVDRSLADDRGNFELSLFSRQVLPKPTAF